MQWSRWSSWQKFHNRIDWTSCWNHSTSLETTSYQAEKSSSLPFNNSCKFRNYVRRISFCVFGIIFLHFRLYSFIFLSNFRCSLNSFAARKTRDSIVKLIYKNLVQFIMSSINGILIPTSAEIQDNNKHIRILDIAGFGTRNYLIFLLFVYLLNILIF